jgi:putative ABC transport system substrate-binding protein
MNRRTFLWGLTLGTVTAPLAAEAQQQLAGKVYALGILSPQSAPASGRGVVEEKLKELGWIEGQTLTIERAYGEGREARLPELAETLVNRRVDAIWAFGPLAAMAAVRATKTIPIVFWGVSAPVELGLVASLPRPGRNVTGVAYGPGPDLMGKQLEFLKQIAPAVRRVAWIMSSERATSGVGVAVLDAAAQSLGLELRRYAVHRPEDIDEVFAALVAWRARAVGLIGNPLMFRERTRIVELANRNRLASTFGHKAFAEAGGLISYAPDVRETQRQSAVYVDNPPWRSAGRPSRRGADEVRIGHQPQDGQSTWPDDSAVAAAQSGPRD